MKSYVLLCIVVLGVQLQAVTYCIEGGGSKTLLNVLDERGAFLPLEDARKENVKLRVEGGIATRVAPGSNFNKVGRDGFKALLQDLFDGIALKPEDKVIAGIAGLGLPANRVAATGVFEELGFAYDNLTVMGDADLALDLIDRQGAILISGTGSVCFAKNDGLPRRQVGGMGTVLGDEGSGYRIGLAALKKALAMEEGYGASTMLIGVVHEFFSVSIGRSLKVLHAPIMKGEITSAHIAQLAPKVFEMAYDAKDAVAMEVIDGAATELGTLLATMIGHAHLERCPLHLWGGTFKNVHAADFIRKIFASDTRLAAVYDCTNRANENPAVLLARKQLSGVSAS